MKIRNVFFRLIRFESALYICSSYVISAGIIQIGFVCWLNEISISLIMSVRAARQPRASDTRAPVCVCVCTLLWMKGGLPNQLERAKVGGLHFLSSRKYYLFDLVSLMYVYSSWNSVHILPLTYMHYIHHSMELYRVDQTHLAQKSTLLNLVLNFTCHINYIKLLCSTCLPPCLGDLTA